MDPAETLHELAKVAREQNNKDEPSQFLNKIILF